VKLNVMGSRDAPKRSYTGYANAEVNAPKQPSSASSTAGSGKPAGAYKEPSNNSIYKDYGGYMNFLHCHGLRVWNMEDVDEGHKIVDEIKQNMREDHEAAQAAAKPTTK
jgi:hypothetical protein